MLYAYDLASKARDEGKDVALWRNTQPLGLASDGITLWVSDYHDGMVSPFAQIWRQIRDYVKLQV